MAITVPQEVLERARRNQPGQSSNSPRFGTFAWKMASYAGSTATVLKPIVPAGPVPPSPAVLYLGSFNLYYNNERGTDQFPITNTSFQTTYDTEWIYAAYLNRSLNLLSTPCTLNVVLTSENTNNFVGQIALYDVYGNNAIFDYNILQSSPIPTAYPLTLRYINGEFDFANITELLIANLIERPGNQTFFYLTTTFNPEGLGEPIVTTEYDPLFYYVDNTQPILSFDNNYSYIIVNSAVNTFYISFDGLTDLVTVNNNFNINNFNACNLTISTITSSISSNRSTLYIGNSAMLSAVNNEIYTLSYYNTGSLILGLEKGQGTLATISAYPTNTRCLAPSAVYVTRIGSREVDLKWTPPLINSSTGPILSYLISYQFSNYPEKSKTTWIDYNIRTSTNTITVTGLPIGWVNFKVAAQTSSGIGQFSHSLSSVDNNYWTQGVNVPLSAIPVIDEEPVIYQIAAAGNNDYGQLGI